MPFPKPDMSEPRTTIYLLDLRRIREKATELKYLYLHFCVDDVFTEWNRRAFSARKSHRNVLIPFHASPSTDKKIHLGSFCAGIPGNKLWGATFGLKHQGIAKEKE